jgi:GcrA cell cycle regulator
MSWTDERVELLKSLWAEGLSASQIAAQLGGISRNAVIGKVHRLKLSSRGRAAPAQPRQKKQARAAIGARPAARGGGATHRTVSAVMGATALQQHYEADAVALPALRRAEDVVVPISRRLALTELTEKTCKWPIGDPLGEDFHFCGNDSGDSGPYCTYHARLAFQPASDRRRQK